MTLRITLQPHDEPAWMEKDIGEVRMNLSASVMAKTGMAIAGDSSFGELGLVRFYDDADICVLTAASGSWFPGYCESLK